MAIKHIKGNIFSSKCQTLVNTVNCVGVMGKGIALVHKLRYPQMYLEYKEHCKNKLIRIGSLWLYSKQENAPWILSFPTKFHWKYPSKIEWIEQGLQKFVDTYEKKEITSIAFPLLGTHNGGLDINEVKNYLKGFEGVTDVHDLHIWSLSTSQIALTVHLVMDNITAENNILKLVQSGLQNKFEIEHTTIQIEPLSQYKDCIGCN